MKATEFKATVLKPDIMGDLNEFLRKMDSNQIVSVLYSTNVVQVRKKNEEAPTAVTLSSALVLYEED